jgi:hypothetical protein
MGAGERRLGRMEELCYGALANADRGTLSGQDPMGSGRRESIQEVGGGVIGGEQKPAAAPWQNKEGRWRLLCPGERRKRKPLIPY